MLNTEKVPLFKNNSVCSKKICLYAKSAIYVNNQVVAINITFI